MKNKVFVLIIFTIVLLVFAYKAPDTKQIDNTDSVFYGSDPRNTTYIIDGDKVVFKNGLFEKEIPNSASKQIFRYFGNELSKDLNNDNREDVAFLITKESGGSGSFFYVVAALNLEEGYKGSHGLFLGDRIAPQNIVSGTGRMNNTIVVNYADRQRGEPFTTQPSEGKSIWLLLDKKTMQFGEVVQNFEGEADISKMNLFMKTWRWLRTLYDNDSETRPKVDKFTLTFNKDGTFSAGTDCNSVGGKYLTNKDKISFIDVFSTEMYCEGSQEDIFKKIFNESESFSFTSWGELVFRLKDGGGTVIFK